jgi:short-chain fatty acids transporter
MGSLDKSAHVGPVVSSPTPGDESDETGLARLGLRFTNWAERWFPDAYVFVALAVAVVAAGALINGASAAAVATAFGDGFWSLIPFTMQAAMVVISGYIVACSPPAVRLIDALAGLPRSGRGAIPFLAAVSMLTSLLNWGMSLVFSGLLARALARRSDLQMDYRAAGAAAYLGGPGRSGSVPRPRSFRRTPQACRSHCCRSPASFRSRRRYSCGNPWCSPQS